jgi:hypothetical protein
VANSEANPLTGSGPNLKKFNYARFLEKLNKLLSWSESSGLFIAAHRELIRDGE